MSDNFDAHERFLADMGLPIEKKAEFINLTDAGKFLDYKPTLLSGLYQRQAEEAVNGIPRLPVDIFSPPIQRILLETSEAHCVPVEMAFANLMALGSALIGASRWVSVKDGSWMEPAFLFILVVASSGSSKTPMMNTFFKRLHYWQEQEKRKFEDEIEEYSEKMQLFRKGFIEEMPSRPREIQYILDNFSFEGLFRLAHDNLKGPIWLKDEFADGIKLLDRYNGGNGNDGPNILIKGFHHDHVCINRAKSENDFYARLGLSLFGGIQPGKLIEQFNAGNIHQGLLQRFIFIWSEREKPLLFSAPKISNEVQGYIKILTDTLVREDVRLAFETDEGSRSYISRRSIAPLSRKAEDLFGEYYNTANIKTFGKSAASFGHKLNLLLLRIALILHYLENVCAYGCLDWEKDTSLMEKHSFLPVICEETMHKAIRVMDVISYHIDYTLAKLNIKERVMSPKIINDPQKIKIENFIRNNIEFCRHYHTAAEFLTRGLSWEYHGKIWTPEISDRDARNCASSLGKALGKYCVDKRLNNSGSHEYKMLGD